MRSRTAGLSDDWDRAGLAGPLPRRRSWGARMRGRMSIDVPRTDDSTQATRDRAAFAHNDAVQAQPSPPGGSFALAPLRPQAYRQHRRNHGTGAHCNHRQQQTSAHGVQVAVPVPTGENFDREGHQDEGD
jgi:hypothetical protein